MFQRLWIFTSIILIALMAFGAVFAQDPAPTDTLWFDNFNDTATDSLAFVNVGWIRFSEEDGLTGSVVKQMDDQLYMQAGSFQVVGAVVAETNGFPLLNPLDLAATGKLLKQNNFSDPNQEVTFQFNLFKFSPGSIFLLATRMLQDDTTGNDFPVSDPTARPAYAFMVNPTTDSLFVAKYEGDFAALNPSTWTYFGAVQFDFEQDIDYWGKFYLNEGKVKAKVWEGDPTDEPADWMIDAVDPDPRVSGKWTMFAILGPPPGAEGGDILKIDNVLVMGFGKPSAVEPEPGVVPKTFALRQNYPNPFNPETTIKFDLAKEGHAKLEIYSLTGRKVRTLLDNNQPAGSYKILFDGRDDFGRALPTGVYFYKLTSGTQVSTRKMLLMK